MVKSTTMCAPSQHTGHMLHHTAGDTCAPCEACADTGADAPAGTRVDGYTAQAPIWPELPADMDAAPPAPRIHPLENCPGCIRHPSHLCAACGAPTAYALAVSSGDGPNMAGHALTLCAPCHAVLLSMRPDGAAALRYVPLAPDRSPAPRRRVPRRPARKAS